MDIASYFAQLFTPKYCKFFALRFGRLGHGHEGPEHAVVPGLLRFRSGEIEANVCELLHEDRAWGQDVVPHGGCKVI